LADYKRKNQFQQNQKLSYGIPGISYDLSLTGKSVQACIVGPARAPYVEELQSSKGLSIPPYKVVAFAHHQIQYNLEHFNLFFCNQPFSVSEMCNAPSAFLFLLLLSKVLAAYVQHLTT
jgi:hypothetical protein